MPPGRRYDGSIGPAGRRPRQPKAPKPVTSGDSSSSTGKGGCFSIVLAVALAVLAAAVLS